MSLGLGLLNALATLASFAALLWYLSGSITLPIDGFAITIPGYMFWVAVLYSGLGSAIAHLIGRPLIRLNNRQQAVEADFRFSLLRLREEAEGIALYGGEAQERSTALGRFRALYDNFKRIILRSNQYLMFQLLFSQFTDFFALLVCLAAIFFRRDPARRADPDRECFRRASTRRCPGSSAATPPSPSGGRRRTG